MLTHQDFILLLILAFLFWPDDHKKELRKVNEKLDKLIALRSRHYDDGK